MVKPMSNWSKTNAVLVFVALVALGFGVVLATAPSMLPPELMDAVTTFEQAVDTQRVLVGIAVVVFLFALWRSYFSGGTDVQDSGIGRDLSAPDPAADVDVVGKRTSKRVDRTIRRLKQGKTADTEPVVEALRASLRNVEAARGHSEQTLEDRVRGGEWTDDRIAAVFLGDESAGTLSIWHRLRRWLFPGRTFENRLERTLAELERHATCADGADTSGRETGVSNERSGDGTEGDDA